MKTIYKMRKLQALLIAVCFFLTSFSLYAENIKLNDEKTAIKVLENTYLKLQVENSVSDINFFEVKTDKGDFTEFSIEGYSYTQKIGFPKLPVNRRLIEIPMNSTATVNVIDFKVNEYTLEELGITNIVFPTQPQVNKGEEGETEIVINQRAYQRNSFNPTTLVSVDVLGIMRGIRIARLNISPIQYNPVTNTVKIYEEINVEVLFEGADVTQTINKKKNNSNIFFNGLKSQILNYKNLDSKELITDSPVKYVIVSDPMFETQLQPFIEWKTKKGFEIIEAYTNDPNVGTSTTSIKNYLEGLYDAGTPDDPPPAFVLFVGDVAQIPAFNGTTGGHVTDLYYCEYTGDMLPELYYGRFSANNAGQLQPQIDKTLEYEQYLMPDPSYLNEVVMVAGMDGSHGYDWGNGQINYGTENYFNTAHGLTAHVYLYPESGSNSANIIQNISDGVSYGNYTAHCSSAGWADPSFTTSDISGLQNANQYGLLVGNCCSSSAYDGTCFAEEILRAANKGALGYIGGSNSTMWDPDYYWGVGVGPITQDPPSYEETTLGAYDGTFHDHGEPIEDWYITQDQMVFAGNLAVAEGAPGSGDYYWEIYCLMGDPSLMIYFSEPPELTISYPGAMMLNSETFTVTTEPYAYVGISRDGVLYGGGIADDSGIAIVSLDPISVPGVVDIVVTKQNRQPHIGAVVVTAPDGPYILMESYEINDAAGNNNGMLDYGETVKLTIAIENVGIATANNVDVTISTTDAYTTINDDSENYGNVDPDEVVSVADGFEIHVGYNVPDDHNIMFAFEATDGIDVWTGTFVIKAHAPILEFVTFEIAGNGTIDPGETTDVTIFVGNIGSADAYNVIGELLSSDPYLTINTASQSYGNITPDNIGEQVFSITADAGTPTGHLANLDFDIEADYDITASGNFGVVIGQIPVVIIDLDEDPSSGAAIQASIDNLNVACEYSTSIPADLSLYSSAFVCLGIYSDNHVLTDSEGQLLADFLNGGGKLYMEGGDTWYYNSPTPVHPMFNINGLADGSSDLGTILGQSGSFTEGMTFNYSGQNSWIDHIAPTGSAVMIFENQSPNYGCGVSFDAGDYATIGVSFEFGGLDDSDATKEELMTKYLEFFGLMSSGGTIQVVELNNGYQFISSRIEVENPDMLVVLEDILNENLDFVRNSNGEVLRKIGPNWVNGIGEWISAEGFLFKMLGAESLEFEGVELNPLTVIDLQIGYQFVSYLPEQSIDALYAFDGILSDDLDYIRNSNGEMLRKIGPNWVNGIGNANPGDGYLIKMFAEDELVYNIPVKATLSSLTPQAVNNFNFEGGNAADPVYTIYVSGLNIGDEVAVYDANKLVGTSVISSDNALDNSIPVFSTISNGQGYKIGNEVTMEVWDAQSQTIISATYTFDNEYPTAYTKTLFPAIDGEFSVVNVTKGAIGTEKTILTEISIYPNPASDILNIVSNNTINRIRVLNSVGQIMFDNESNNSILNINTSNYQSGIYFIQLETNNEIFTEKITIK